MTQITRRVRHEVNGTGQSRFNNKYYAKFRTFAGKPDDEYLSNEVDSASVFDTEEEAIAGGLRALVILNESGRYPNMCEKF